MVAIVVPVTVRVLRQGGATVDSAADNNSKYNTCREQRKLFAARAIRIPAGCSPRALLEWVSRAVASSDAVSSSNATATTSAATALTDSKSRDESLSVFGALLDASGRSVDDPQQLTPDAVLTYLRPSEVARAPSLFAGASVTAAGDELRSSRLFADIHVSSELRRSLMMTQSLRASHPRPGLDVSWGSVPLSAVVREDASEPALEAYSWAVTGENGMLENDVVIIDDTNDEADLTCLEEVLDETPGAVTSSEQVGQSDASAPPKNLRAPIICVLGHVDAGKTSLLDRIRRSSIQAGEAGGITQQIGATMIPIETVRQETAPVNSRFDLDLPGLVVIDTPGHSSFTNLRTRGSSLCDIAILVVDIKHGLRPQTIESLQILQRRQTPFVIALNKVDRLNGWVVMENSPIRDALSSQSDATREDFQVCLKEVMGQLFDSLKLKSSLYWRCRDFSASAAIVPTSAHTGEGMCDLLLLLVLMSQKHLTNRLSPGAMLPLYFQHQATVDTADEAATNKVDFFKKRRPVACTVLDVRVIQGVGPCIDVILIEGYLCAGDRILVSGLDGPIVTSIRHLIKPADLSESRDASRAGRRNDAGVLRVHGVTGVKIQGRHLERAIAGSQLIVLGSKDKPEAFYDEIMTDLNSVLGGQRSTSGVAVHASTIGSLEALLDFLTDQDVPVSSVKIGPVQKNDVLRARSSRRVYSVVLAFDTPVTAPAASAATTGSVSIFSSDVIYRLFQDWSRHVKLWGGHGLDVYPCALQIQSDFLFNTSNPLVMTVEVRGCLVLHSLLTIPYKGRPWLDLGRVIAIRDISTARPITQAGNGSVVTIKIATREDKVTGRTIIMGRDFDFDDIVFSRCDALDSMNDTYREMTTPFMRHYRSVMNLPQIKRRKAGRGNRPDDENEDAWW